MIILLFVKSQDLKKLTMSFPQIDYLKFAFVIMELHLCNIYKF
jgi:hypothetical protein